MKFILSLLLLLCTSQVTFAQGENSNWHFGKKYAINFNQSPPQIEESNIFTLEGCSTVSDADGNLLFYTMGPRIWDKNGNEMPNSSGLLGNGPINSVTGLPVGSSYNGVAIVINPTNHNQYYIFSGETDITTHKLYYSLVDMTLNNGLGDILPSVKNIVLMNDVSEEICPANGPDCKSSWLIARQYNTNDYFAFKIDMNGVSLIPVITPCGNSTSPCQTGHIMFAPDGVTIIASGLNVTLSKFNNITGEIYDFTPLNISATGIPEFSPDATKLYITFADIAGSRGIKQIDLSLLPNIAAVTNSAINIATASIPQEMYSYVRLGPDGKIYTLKTTTIIPWTMQIGRIDFPNTAGLGCQYIPSAYPTPSWVDPNDPFFSLGRTFFIRPVDTLYHPLIDTFICGDIDIELSSTVDNGIYKWNNNDTTKSIIIPQAGTYIVAGTNNCGTVFDSFYVSNVNFQLKLGSDTTICKGDKIKLSIPTNISSKVLWNTSDTSETIYIDTEGTYIVSVENACGSFTDSIDIDIINCNCIPFIPNAFSPNSDLINDRFGIEFICNNYSEYSLSIYNRFGQRVFLSSDPDDRWDGTYNGNIADVGTYFYYLTFMNRFKERNTYKGDITLLR